MSDKAQLVSKVLVLDSNKEYLDRIKSFCDDNNLIGLKAQEDNVMGVLKSNVDMGAILLSENYAGNPRGGIALAQEIHDVRPELPIFLRREHTESLDDLSEKEQKIFRATYTIDGISKLQDVIAESIFSLVYPNALVRGITEITLSALESQFIEIDIITETPYIVRDRIIFGEIFSLIPIESGWCRGYMMLQTDVKSLLEFVKREKTYVDAVDDNFRNLDPIMGEVTNLIWGQFKSRFISYDEKIGEFKTQVPIIVNHQHKYISFGSDDPQLCFKYSLTDRNNADTGAVVIYQRFIFNLNWSPDNFKENRISIEDLIESGELEMF